MTEQERQNVIQKIADEKVIVIVRGVASKDLIPFAEAIYAGGIRLMEITYSATGEIPAETTAADIKALKDHFGDRMAIGAGTVLYEKQVTLTAQAGGEFIISPNANTEIIRKSRALGLVSIPGALTPTECESAHEAGADFVKLFPVCSLGSDYVKAISAPLSHIRFLAVGGVDLGNMEQYAKAGAVGFGIGSSIVNKKMIAAGDFAGITEMTRAFLATARESFKK